LPMLRPTLLLIVVLATIHATQAFETILLLTDGGPANATRLVVQNMYDSAFVRLQPGYGVTQAILLLPLILFIAGCRDQQSDHDYREFDGRIRPGKIQISRP
jgi:putative chitobiose transport system permease protein